MHLSHLLAQFIRSIYNAVEKSYCSLHWFWLLPSLLSVATLPLVYMEKSRSQIICHTFSQYLNTLHSLAGNMEERLSIRSTARSPQVMMSLPLKLYLQTPTNLGRGTTASTSHPTAGSLISTDVKTRELLGYYSFSNIFIHEIFYLQKSDSQCSSTDGQPYQSFPGRQQPTGKSKGQRQI